MKLLHFMDVQSLLLAASSQQKDVFFLTNIFKIFTEPRTPAHRHLSRDIYQDSVLNDVKMVKCTQKDLPGGVI